MTASDDFVPRMSDALADAGFPRMPARVFAALLVDDDGRMTAAELCASLGASTGAVSEAVRYLEGVGMLRRERRAGQRFDTYVVEDDSWHDAMLRTESRYAPLLAALESGLAGLPGGTPAHRRLATSREFLRFVQDELADLAERWAARRAGPPR